MYGFGYNSFRLWLYVGLFVFLGNVEITAQNTSGPFKWVYGPAGADISGDMAYMDNAYPTYHLVFQASSPNSIAVYAQSAYSCEQFQQYFSEYTNTAVWQDPNPCDTGPVFDSVQVYGYCLPDGSFVTLNAARQIVQIKQLYCTTQNQNAIILDDVIIDGKRYHYFSVDGVVHQGIPSDFGYKAYDDPDDPDYPYWLPDDLMDKVDAYLDEPIVYDTTGYIDTLEADYILNEVTDSTDNYVSDYSSALTTLNESIKSSGDSTVAALSNLSDTLQQSFETLGDRFDSLLTDYDSSINETVEPLNTNSLDSVYNQRQQTIDSFHNESSLSLDTALDENDNFITQNEAHIRELVQVFDFSYNYEETGCPDEIFLIPMPETMGGNKQIEFCNFNLRLFTYPFIMLLVSFILIGAGYKTLVLAMSRVA